MIVRGLLRDRRGSVSVLSALLATVLIGFTALSVDLGQFYYAKRRLQTAVDIATTAAAADLGRAEDAAAANIAANGFPPAALAAVERGTYTADPAIPPDRRFVAGAGGTTNAVRVTARSFVPVIFGKALLGGAGAVAVRAQAIGIAGNAAAFSLGSRLAGLDAGVANAVLGGLLGTHLSLALADYRALAATRVDLFAFADALAVQAALPSGATYADLLGRGLRADQVLAALTAVVGPPDAAAAMRAIGAAVGPSSPAAVPLAGLMAFGPFSAHTVGARPPMAVKVGLFDILFAAARLGGAGGLVQVRLTPATAPVLDMALAMTLGAPAVGTSFLTLGAEGATLRTAQVRLLLTVTLAAVPPLATVSLPLYLELAPATARLDSFACSPTGSGSVTLAVTPGVADAWIGAVAPADLRAGPVLPPPSAVLASLLGLARVTGRAHAAVANLAPTLVPFTTVDVAAARVKTVSTTDYLTALVSTLVSSLQIGVDVLGWGAPAGLNTATAATVTGALPAIDATLASVLTSLGVSIGDADVTVDGLRCGLGLLAN